MKLIPLLFGVSLVANATLLVVLYRPESAAKSEPPVPAPKSAIVSSESKEKTAAEAKTVDQPPADKAVSWPELHSANLADMVSRLRAAGFPPSALRALVWLRLTEQMADKRKELLAGVEDVPFWKVKRPMFDAKFMMAQRQFYQEQTKLAKELLGRDAVEENELNVYLRKRQFGDISADKEEKLQRVTGDYGDLTNSVYSESNGMFMPEDSDKIAYLEKEMLRDLAEILSPAEMENYELRSSRTANELRSQLTTFQPTEEEFRALFRAARNVEEKYGSNSMGMTFDQRQQRTAALNEQAKLVLSPGHFAQFEQATNPMNSALNRIVSRYNLPTTVVPQVTAVQKDIQQRAAALRQLPAAEQTAQAQALQKEAAAKLQPLLGESGYRAYKTNGGQWLEQITRPPTGGPGTMSTAGAPKVGSSK